MQTEDADILFRPGYCPYCNEEIKPGEPLGIGITPPHHRECLIRAVAGSAGHQLGACHCYLKNSVAIEDPPHLTLREAAKLAYEIFQILSQKAEAEANGGLRLPDPGRLRQIIPTKLV
jgi:hypothetical protein